MPTKSANDALFQSRLAGKSVCFAGRFNRWTHDPFVQFLKTERVQVEDDIDDSLDYLVLGATGFAALQKKAEQLNQKKGARIRIVDEPQFFALLVPTLDEALELARSGEKGIGRLNILYGQQLNPHMPSLNGQDLRNADLRNLRFRLADVDLRGANLGDTVVVMQNCRLDGAQVDNAEINLIQDCSATDIDFSKAKSIYGFLNLRNTDFTGSKFRAVRIRKANFTGCKLDDADFRGADLSACEFSGIRLPNTDFSTAILAESKFDGADLRGCKFLEADLTCADLTGANVEGADFTNAKLTGAILAKVDVSKAIGLDAAHARSKVTIGDAVKKWVQVSKKAQKLATCVKLQKDKQEITLHFTLYPGYMEAQDNHSNYWSYTTAAMSVPTTPEQVLMLVANRWAGATPIPYSVTVSASKASQPSKELKVLAIRMWCELFGVALPSEDELRHQKKAAQASKNSQIEEWVQTLRNDANGVEKWNDDAPMAIKHLKGKLHGVNLSKAKLAGWRCEHMDCKGCDFSEADLRKCQLQGTRLVGCNLAHANLQEVYFLYGSLKNATCRQANFAQADLRHADLCGADFTEAILTDARFDGAKFDEHTKFPKGFKPPLDMKWQGAGPSPALAVQVAKLKAKKPLDIDAFMKRLEAGTDSAKLDKALAMLKADRFKLYAQVTDDHLVGIVKSQGDPNLVYSCKLASNGVYGCCTQNLNICGGLRGSLCKHLLVLIVGLTRAGDLDPNVIDTWVLSSKGQKPVLDKDAMSETFLRYKGAEAGEVDWRPTETIPEDYYAM